MLHLLLVSPRFPPSSAADSQRLRMLLPHLADHGCTAEVLAVDPRCCVDPLDPWQCEGLPPQVPIHRVQGWSRRWSRLPGLGSVEARCYGALATAGDRLLQTRAFDGVLFSTTAFGCFRLGRRWQRRFGVPFVLDYQDPWVNDYYRQNRSIIPPGGRLKHAVVDHLSRLQEPRVLQDCAGLIAVSPAYLNTLQQRYPFTADRPSLVLPFPGEPQDFERLASIPPQALPFDPDDGQIHWLSIGRGGADLAPALCGLFLALQRHADPRLLARLRLHCLGTSYAAEGTGVSSIRHLAERHGLADLVEERTERLPLSITLASLRAADALLVLGSEDPAYHPSKLLPYLLARRPLLAILHARSGGVSLIQRCGGARLVTFDAATETPLLAAAIDRAWLQRNRCHRPLPLDHTAIAPHTASSQAAQLISFLDACFERYGRRRHVTPSSRLALAPLRSRR